MIVAQDLLPLKDAVQKASSAYVLLGMNPNYDAVASALSIYLSLKSAGKEAYIFSSAPMRVEFSHLVGVDEVKDTVGNRNLVVSFAYEESSVEKVNYNISEDGKRFQLVIAPKAGGKPLDPSTIEYSRSGAEADLVFMVGVSRFEDLGSLFEAERALFDNAFTVSITPYQVQPYAALSLDTVGQSCTAEGVAAMLIELGMEPRDDIATNLLGSIEQATQRFQSLATQPETLELAARLMRNGARRSSGSNPAMQTQPGQVPAPGMPPAPQPLDPQAISTPAFAQALRARRAAQMSGAQMPQQFPMQQPLPQQMPVQAPTSQPLQVQTIPQLQRVDQQGMQDQLVPDQQVMNQGVQQNPPKDWTEPKIFTGSTSV